jgi:hypothetical protein
MKHTSTRKTLATAIALLLGATALSNAFGQDVYVAPRTIDGQPDMQGVWANNSTTPLQRPEIFADRAELSEDEYEQLLARLHGNRTGRRRCAVRRRLPECSGDRHGGIL